MTALTIRDFRNQMASSLDRVDAGEQVFIRRNRQLYTIVPVSDGGLVITPELQVKIDNARKEYQAGNTLHFENAAAAQKWMDEL